MRLIALLNWFDEPVENIASCLIGLQRAGVDHVVAVDGAYDLYPNAQHSSHPNQHAALDMGCLALEMGITLHVPNTPWKGNEVEKRTFLFSLGWTVSQDPTDWFFVMDVDQEVKEVPDDFRARLEAATAAGADVAETNFVDTVALRAKQPDWHPYFTVRNLFRAQPIHLEVNHCTYVTDDGKYLWGGPVTYTTGVEQVLQGAADFTDVLVEHHPDRRPNERQLAKMQYYAVRDETRVERGHCQQCDAPASRMVAVRWRKTKVGPVADWTEACEDCALLLDKISRVELQQMGVDPDRVKVENRYGKSEDMKTDKERQAPPRRSQLVVAPPTRRR